MIPQNGDHYAAGDEGLSLPSWANVSDVPLRWRAALTGIPTRDRVTEDRAATARRESSVIRHRSFVEWAGNRRLATMTRASEVEREFGCPVFVVSTIHDAERIVRRAQDSRSWHHNDR